MEFSKFMSEFKSKILLPQRNVLISSGPGVSLPPDPTAVIWFADRNSTSAEALSVPEPVPVVPSGLAAGNPVSVHDSHFKESMPCFLSPLDFGYVLV